MACVIDLYSASVLDRATTVCFLLFHVTMLPSTKVQNPIVDLRFDRESAQSVSENLLL